MSDGNLAADEWTKLWLTRGFEPVKDPDSDMITINGVSGFLTPGDVQTLWNLGRSLPMGGSYLEVGSWMGLSSIIIATSVLSRLNFGAQIFCVDTWEGSPGIHQEFDEIKEERLYDVYLENIKSAGVDHFICPRRGPSLEIAETFPNQSLDIIFIDGDHSYKACLKDMEAWAPKLKPGGRMLGHDATPDSDVRRAVIDYCKKYDVQHEITPSPHAFYVWELK